MLDILAILCVDLRASHIEEDICLKIGPAVISRNDLHALWESFEFKLGSNQLTYVSQIVNAHFLARFRDNRANWRRSFSNTIRGAVN